MSETPPYQLRTCLYRCHQREERKPHIRTASPEINVCNVCNKAFIMRHLSRETYSEAQIISAHLAAIPETPGQAPSLLR